MRNLKAMGLFVIVFAVMGVSSASAVEFKSASAPVTVTGSGTEATTFTTTAGTVNCKQESYTGTASSTSQATLTVTPSYSECSGFGFSATIDMNSCDYLFHASGTVDIVCPAGNEITVTATSFGTTKCVVHVPPQTGLGTITFDNEGTGETRDVKVTANVTGIHYSHTAGTGFGACGTGTGTAGKLEGTVTTTGETDPGTTHVGIWVE
jgi:hypothetical protein